ERTPHNNPQAKGVFFGLTHQHGPNELARAVLEGVGYALADGMDVVHACGIKPQSVTLIGGGARIVALKPKAMQKSFGGNYD
ncbi:FGGY-family carbohydrate kinase, partial [Escherichia sp. TWPC-MK]